MFFVCVFLLDSADLLFPAYEIQTPTTQTTNGPIRWPPFGVVDHHLSLLLLQHLPAAATTPAIDLSSEERAKIRAIIVWRELPMIQQHSSSPVRK